MRRRVKPGKMWRYDLVILAVGKWNSVDPWDVASLAQLATFRPVSNKTRWWLLRSNT